VASAVQAATKAPPMVAPEEKSSVGQGAGEASWKSDNSRDGFRQFRITMSDVLPSAEMQAAFEAELLYQISSVAAGEDTAAPGIATMGGGSPRRSPCAHPLLRRTQRRLL
jgi:hypothetical protein